MGLKYRPSRPEVMTRPPPAAPTGGGGDGVDKEGSNGCKSSQTWTYQNFCSHPLIPRTCDQTSSRHYHPCFVQTS